MRKGVLIFSLFLTIILISGCVEQPAPSEEKSDCPYECCIGETYNPKECVADYECMNNVCVEVGEGKLDCPYECCVDEQYKSKACSISYECKENACIEIGDGRAGKIPFFEITEDFNKENDIASLSSNDLRELGVKIVKFEMGEAFIWDFIEPSKGEFDFTMTDKVVSEASDSGVSISPILWPYALWDQGGKEECKVAGGGPMPEIMPKYRCKPQDMEEYKYFLKEFVERYDGDNDFGSYPIDESLENKIRQNPIIYWRVIDEPDVGDDITVERQFEGTLKDYFDLLKNSYEAIKEACEECQIVIAPPVESIRGYYSDLLSFGAGDYFDIYNMKAPIKELEEIAGPLDKPVFADAGGTDEVDMAKRAILLAADGFSSVGLSMVPDWTKYNIKVGGGKEDEEKFFKGYLLFKDGSKTPLYYALQILVTELEYFKKVESVEVKEGVLGFKFYFEDKAPVYAFFIGDQTYNIWPVGLEFPRGNDEETISLDFEQFLVKDIYGNEEIKTQSFTLEWDNVYLITEK